MNKLRVDLFNLGDFAGLIISAPTGVIYTNQTGGTHCCQEQLEGFFVPLTLFSDEDPLEGYSEHLMRPAPLDSVRRAKLMELAQQRIAAMSLAKDLEALDIEASPTQSIREAWIPVLVKQRPDMMLAELAHLAGHVGILTYQNSD